MDKRHIQVSAPGLHAIRNGGAPPGLRVVATDVELLQRRRCADPDPRVRTEAVQQLEQMCQNGRVISVESYPTISNLCTNTAKNVRVAALRIVQKFGEKYPEHVVTTEKGFKLRLHDDAFAQVCHAVNDIETDVRCEAARLLGEFGSVSDHFLQQTLDKKVMKTMQYKMDQGGTPRRPTSGGGGWSVGKKLGEDVPIETDEDEKEAMIPIGACGALVAGLEDEFMSVRQAAVFSLGRLAAHRPDFACASIDHLADMFNDEMQQVRLGSIQSLTPLIVHGTLAKEQLHTILNVLSDATAENRLALHELLGKANLAEHGCVKQVVKALLDSLKRFPRDRESVHRCLSKIGRRHALFVQSLVPDLLNIHPIFDPIEADIGDEFYLCHLVVVLNAAYVHDPICSLIPSYILKHYRYLRQSDPNLIPVIETFERKKMSAFSGANDESYVEAGVLKHLQLICKRIFQAYSNPNIEQKVSLLKVISRDLKLAETSEEQCACALQFLKLICRALLTYDLCLSRIQYDEGNIDEVIEECIEMVSHIQRLFTCVPRKILGFLKDIELQLSVALTLRHLNVDPLVEWTSVTEQIQKEVVLVQKTLIDLGIQQTAQSARFYKCVFGFLDNRVESEMTLKSAKAPKKPAIVPLLSTDLKMLSMELVKNRVNLPDFSFNLRRLKRKSARSLEFWHAGNWYFPETGVLRFVAGIPVGVEVYSTIYNIDEEDRKYFRVGVTYPDNRQTYHKPRERDLFEISEGVFRLQTNVLISTEEPWAVPSEVTLACGLLVNKDTLKVRFVPLMNAHNSSRVHGTEIRIHPMVKCC